MIIIFCRKNSHEDDHKWDRKHPHRSGSTDRLRNSSSSSQTDTDKPSEFELVNNNVIFTYNYH